MGVDEAVTDRLVAGLGFRRATSADEILALLHRALANQSAPLGCLATPADRADAPAIRAVAGALGVPLVAVAADAMIAVDARVLTRSARIAATRGVGSVAEAAALAVAGAAATLILPRIASAGATCALALARESVTQAP
ncbi:cobalamin biosynthesis protein [Methylobacterium sp. Leaf100]|uniref:cobalamin biosynthesis protein n=1 Tax=Methylobacterium sp. Leaf100 TaxID=1736252 RepID=UPI0006F7AA2D|nr:cobalamin biosynthesis protein [Methylobacterium sp. Leaf100]KQP32291.1 precorrin methylase [Methylobacterium sp. Leaf100]